MKSFLSPNISTAGRIVRGLGAVALIIGGILALRLSIWLTVALLASGGFVLFEALRGWCVLRACGIKTKL